jgi:hypothetical protein
MKSLVLRILAMIALSAIGVGMLVVIARQNNAGARDFIEYWTVGHELLQGRNPYDAAAIFPLQKAAGIPTENALVSFSPPVAFFFVLPLGLVNANLALVIWLLLLLVSLAASIRMLWTLHGRPNNRLHLIGYCFAPVMFCLMAGQLGIFLLLGVTVFLTFYRTRPFLAGAALLPCTLKPHLFMPFAIVLLLWVIANKAYRILLGSAAILIVSCALTLCWDPRIWSQYFAMMHSSGVLLGWVPSLASTFRFLVHREFVWLEFVPEIGACIWAVWYFRTHRTRWDWLDHGMLVLLVAAICTPYGWITDEAMLIPAVLAGIYRADESGRSLWPFGVVASVAVAEVIVQVPLATSWYLWTTPAWLAWFIYATGRGWKGRSKLQPAA